MIGRPDGGRSGAGEPDEGARTPAASSPPPIQPLPVALPVAVPVPAQLTLGSGFAPPAAAPLPDGFFRTQHELAVALEVSERRLRNWGVQPEADGTWSRVSALTCRDRFKAPVQTSALPAPTASAAEDDDQDDDAGEDGESKKWLAEKRKWQALQARDDYELKHARLIEVDDVRARWVRAFEQVAQELRSMPAELRAQLLGADDVETERILHEAIEARLERLRQHQPWAA